MPLITTTFVFNFAWNLSLLDEENTGKHFIGFYSVVSQIPLSAQLLLLSLAQTLGLLVGLSISLLIVGVRV